MSRLDWSDPEAVRRWVIDLRVVADDLDGVIDDMLAPARKREMGHAMHTEKCREARKSIVQALAYALPPDGDDGEHGDPSGNGGAGTAH